MPNPKGERKIDKKGMRHLRRLIVVTVVAVLCYSFTAYAWFQASFVSTNNSITAGTFSLAVSVTGNGTSVSPDQNSTYQMEANTAYTLTLTASGSAKGYCTITRTSDMTTYNTVQMATGETLTFTLVPATSAGYTFTSHWGTPAGDDLIQNAGTIGTLNTTGYNTVDNSDDQTTGDQGQTGGADDQSADQTDGSNANQPDSNVPTGAPTDVGNNAGTGADTTGSEEAGARDTSTGADDTDTSSSAADNTHQTAQTGASSATSDEGA